MRRRLVGALIAIAAVAGWPNVAHEAHAVHPAAGTTQDAPVGIGRMYVPRLRAQVWGMPIYVGVSDGELDRGIGWFPTSAEPGMAGNFALAGHRTEAKRPFYFVEKLRKGDEVIVRTDAAWFVYRLTRQRIVTPRSTWVLDPVPDPTLRATPDAAPRLITLVTCTPRGTTRQRWIWWGSLSAVYPPDAPPPSIGTLRTP